MALFGSKKKTDAKAPKADVKATTESPQAQHTQAIGSKANLGAIIKHARITEKASMQQAAGVYVFNVDTSASKRDVIQAVRSIYQVTPRAVRMVNIRQKTIRSMRTGKSGVKGGGKKAYVYLKAGETINL